MLKENAVKNKVMVFKKIKYEMVDFDCPSRVRIECPNNCDIRLNKEILEELHEFRYRALVLCKRGRW